MAVDLEKDKKYKEAIFHLNIAIEKKDRFKQAFLNRGFCKTELGDLVGGIDDYKKLLAFDYDNTFALFNLGNNYSLLADNKKAIYYYSKALQTEGALKSFVGSGGKPSGIAVSLDANYGMLDCEIYFERGIAYLEENQFDKAIFDINKSLEVNNAKKDCYFLLGKAFLGKNDSIDACESFIKSAKLGDKEAREMLRKHCIKKTKSN